MLFLWTLLRHSTPCGWRMSMARACLLPAAQTTTRGELAVASTSREIYGQIRQGSGVSKVPCSITHAEFVTHHRFKSKMLSAMLPTALLRVLAS